MGRLSKLGLSALESDVTSSIIDHPHGLTLMKMSQLSPWASLCYAW